MPASQNNRSLGLALVLMMVVVAVFLAFNLSNIHDAKSTSQSNHKLLCANYQLRLQQDPIARNNRQLQSTFNKECK